MGFARYPKTRCHFVDDFSMLIAVGWFTFGRVYFSDTFQSS
jgi:hypothetical protein